MLSRLIQFYESCIKGERDTREDMRPTLSVTTTKVYTTFIVNCHEVLSS